MRTLIIATALVFIAQISFGQDLDAARKRATEKTATMKQELGLTQSQETQVLALNIELEEAIEKLNSNATLAKTDKTTQFDEIDKKERDQLKIILSTEQYAKYYSESEPSKAKIHTSRSSIKKN